MSGSTRLRSQSSVALIDVGHAGQSELQHGLRQAVLRAEPGDALGEGQEGVEKRSRAARVEGKLGEAEHRLLVGRVGRRPGGVHLGLAQRLGERPLDALGIGGEALRVGRGAEQLDRPGADQHLVEHVLVIAVGRRGALDVAARGAQDAAPDLHLFRPVLRQLGQHREARPRILAALGVVGRGAEHGVRPALGALAVGLVESGEREAELFGIAAHLVERDEAVVAVEGGVLEPLRHHRAAVLLQLHGQAQHGMAAEAAARLRHQLAGEAPGQEVEDARIDFGLVAARACDRPVEIALVVRCALAGRVHIGAIDREAGDDLADGAVEDVAGEIGGARVLPRHAGGIASEHVELARHLVLA